MGVIRSFIAVNLPEELKEKIGAEIPYLKDSGADVKWVDPESMHITLKFLGYVPEEKIDQVAFVAAGVAREIRPFELIFRGTGAFPAETAPRVVWVGVEDPSGMLMELQKRLEEALSGLGFEKEGGFNAHITLGRVKSPKNRQALAGRLATLRGSLFGKIKVENIHLMKSELRPGGSLYSALSQIKLGPEENKNEGG